MQRSRSASFVVCIISFPNAPPQKEICAPTSAPAAAPCWNMLHDISVFAKRR